MEEEEREKEGKRMRKRERGKEIQNKVTDTGTTPMKNCSTLVQ